MSRGHCAKCSNPYIRCANRDCRCHPLSEERRHAVIDQLRTTQAKLRDEAAYAETHPTDGEAPQWT